MGGKNSKTRGEDRERGGEERAVEGSEGKAREHHYKIYLLRQTRTLTVAGPSCSGLALGFSSSDVCHP